MAHPPWAGKGCRCCVRREQRRCCCEDIQSIRAYIIQVTSTSFALYCNKKKTPMIRKPTLTRIIYFSNLEINNVYHPPRRYQKYVHSYLDRTPVINLKSGLYSYRTANFSLFVKWELHPTLLILYNQHKYALEPYYHLGSHSGKHYISPPKWNKRNTRSYLNGAPVVHLKSGLCS